MQAVQFRPQEIRVKRQNNVKNTFQFQYEPQMNDLNTKVIQLDSGIFRLSI